jgi:hypothetical protein
MPMEAMAFTVINDLLLLHFPHVEGTRAPSFDTAVSRRFTKIPMVSRLRAPVHLVSKSTAVLSLPVIKIREVTMWFIDGLLARLNSS